MKQALIVGIGHYKSNKKNNNQNKNQLHTIDGAVSNAHKMAQGLKNHFKSDIFTTNQNQIIKYIFRKELKDKIIELFKPLQAEAPHTALFYFSGYILIRNQGIQEVFLATSDSDRKSGYWGISLQWLWQILEKSKVQRQIIILDCYHENNDKPNFDKVFPQKESENQRLIIAHSLPNSKKNRNQKSSTLNDIILENINKVDSGWLTSKNLIEELASEKEDIFFRNPTEEFNIIFRGNSDEPEKDASKENKNDVHKMPCPYKGLKSFEDDEKDFKKFYGRNILTEKLLTQVDSNNFLAIMGASGSGKSSVIKAGLVYLLKKGHNISNSDNWYIKVIQPGRFPRYNLAWAFVSDNLQKDERNSKFIEYDKLLNNKGADGLKEMIDQVIDKPDKNRVILIIDQLEELFTLSENPGKALSKDWEQYKFIECILGALEKTDGEFCLVLAIRADFFGKCVEDEYFGLARKIQQNLVTVTPITRKKLEEAITKPAESVGMKVDDKLKNKLLEDTENISGSLPLLQYTLKKLWEEHNKSLTLKNYNDLGGLKEIINKQASTVYEKLEEEGKDIKIADLIFINLIQIGNGTGDTRKYIPRQEIIALHEGREFEKDEIEEVLSQLEKNDLIINNQEKQDNGQEVKIVTLIHEVLIQHWSRLHDLLKNNRDILQQKETINEDAKKWNDNNQSPKYLLKDKTFDTVEFLKQHKYIVQLSDLGNAYIKASIKQRTCLIMQTILSILIAIILFLLLAFKIPKIQQNNFQLDQSAALTRYSDTLFREGQKFDALIEGLRAALPLKERNLKIPKETTVALRQAVSGVTELNRLEKHKGSVYSLSFSPNDNGRSLASASADGTIKLWDVTTGKEIDLPNKMQHKGKVYSVSFSPDGKILASSGLDGRIKLWDVYTGKEIDLPNKMQQDGKVYSVSFSPDGQQLASGCINGSIKIWEVVTGKEIDLPNKMQQDSIVYSVSFSPNGKKLASGGADGKVRLWNLEKGDGKIISQGDSTVYSINFSPSDRDKKIEDRQIRKLAFGLADGAVKLWDAETNETTVLYSHDYIVYNVSFNNDDKILASGSLDNTVKLWNLETGKEIATITGHKDWVFNVTFSPDKKTLASASADNSIKLWNIKKIEETTTLTGHKDWINSVIFNPKNSNQLVSASTDGSIKFWDIAIGKEDLPSIHQESNISNKRKRRFNNISFNSDGQKLVSSSADGMIQIWDVNTRKQINYKFLGNNIWIDSVTFSPDDKKLAFTTSSDYTVKIWDLETDEIIPLFRGNDGFGIITFNRDGTKLAAAGFDKTIKIWDVNNLEKAPIELNGHENGHKNKVNSVSFSPDGKFLVSGSFDKTLKVWNLRTNELKSTLEGHTGKVYSVSFSPTDTKIVASGSADKTIRLWNIYIGKEIKTFAEHQNDVLSVTFNPDGNKLASASADGKMILWNIPDSKQIALKENKDLIEEGCDWARGYLHNNPNFSDKKHENERHMCDDLIKKN